MAKFDGTVAEPPETQGDTGVSDAKPTIGTDPALPDADRHSEAFRQSRAVHRTELAEDYVELIADLIAELGEARQVDIAARMGVAQPTVAKALTRLADDGLISRRPYRGILLTDDGQAMALAIKDRHRTVQDFLLFLGVDADTARIDAEGIEHHVSPQTLAAFRRAMSRD